MAYKQVSYGSSGSDVRELQKKLNENGYSLEVDGQFGSKTQAAVKDYQKKNNLQVDGIAGKNTWGSLSKAVAPQTTTQKTPAQPSPYEQAMQNLQAAQGKTPEYSASYDEQMNQLFQKIMNREKFSYDPNADTLYQQYRDLYMQQGQQAMQDTMGQAAALTGGYGSSYGQNVGQQAYNQYLQQLGEVVPELYGQAADRYAQEGQALYDQYAMMGDLRDTEYGRYQDALDQYWQNLGWLGDRADTEYSKMMDERDFAYQQERDRIADEQWERQFAEQQRQYNASLAARNSGGGGGGSNEKKGEDEEDTGPKFATTPMKAQSYNQLGVNLESKWRNFGIDAALDLLQTNIPNMTEDQFNYWAEMLEKWAELEG